MFEAATVSIPPGAGLLPCLLSVLAGLPASRRIYLSKPSFYLGCVSRAAGVDGGAEGCQAPVGHPVSCGSPTSSAACEPSVGWPSREPFPWIATCSVCLVRAKLSVASISWAAFCCLVCPAASVRITQDELNLRGALPTPLPALFETRAIQSSGMLAFTCGEETPHAPFNKQSSASVLGFSPQRNVLHPGWALHQPQAPTLPPTAGRGGGWPPAEQGWGFPMAVRGCSWGSESVRGRRAASVLGARRERLEGISHPVLAGGSAFMNAAGI